jgi:DNA-directed RNA polymerase
MLMTAIDCTRRGLVFSAVHDSFWTHPRDVDVLSASLRDQFIRLYSLPLLEQLRDSLRLRFPGLDIPELPGYGDLDLEEVRDSPYFFS